MGSRDETTPHQPLLSSLVVRPSDSGGGVGGGGGGGGGSDYEPGEVRRDVLPYSRSERYSGEPALVAAWCKNLDLEEGVSCVNMVGSKMGFTAALASRRAEGLETGYRTRAISGSPVRGRDIDRRYSPEYDPLDDHGFGGRGTVRSPARFRDYSPPYPRGRGGRSFGRASGGPGFGPGPFRGEGLPRNNSNVRPREGDWYCPDPICGNLNFARREHCNSCGRYRYAPMGNLRRGRGGPPPMGPPRRFPGPPPMDRSPGRFNGGYRSPPPRGWPRDGPRDFGPPPFRPDHPPRRDRFDYPEDEFRGRGKLDRLPPPEWAPRERARDAAFLDRKGYDRRPLSPPPPAPTARGRWAEREIRERSRSPLRGGPPPPREFRRDPYGERGRDDRRGAGRGRIGNVY